MGDPVQDDTLINGVQQSEEETEASILLQGKTSISQHFDITHQIYNQ